MSYMRLGEKVWSKVEHYLPTLDEYFGAPTCPYPSHVECVSGPPADGASRLCAPSFDLTIFWHEIPHSVKAMPLSVR